MPSMRQQLLSQNQHSGCVKALGIYLLVVRVELLDQLRAAAPAVGIDDLDRLAVQPECCKLERIATEV